MTTHILMTARTIVLPLVPEVLACFCEDVDLGDYHIRETLDGVSVLFDEERVLDVARGFDALATLGLISHIRTIRLNEGDYDRL